MRVQIVANSFLVVPVFLALSFRTVRKAQDDEEDAGDQSAETMEASAINATAEASCKYVDARCSADHECCASCCSKRSKTCLDREKPGHCMGGGIVTPKCTSAMRKQCTGPSRESCCRNASSCWSSAMFCTRSGCPWDNCGRKSALMESAEDSAEDSAEEAIDGADAILANANLALNLVNEERKKVGARNLRLNSKLNAACRVHTADMSRHKFKSHRGSDGSTFQQRAARQGYSWSGLVENVGESYKNTRAAMSGWMASSGHRNNILNTQWTEMGYAENTSGWRTYCQLFGAPKR